MIHGSSLWSNRLKFAAIDKKIFAILFLICVFILFSFLPAKVKNDLERECLKGKVKCVTEYGYSGAIRAKPHTFSKHYYDQKGNLVEDLYLDGDSNLMRKSVFKRNALGLISESQLLNPSGKLEHKYREKYDLRGNKVETCSYMDDGALTTCFYYTYDKKGMMVRETRGTPGNIAAVVDYTYDSLGLMTRMIRKMISYKSIDTADYTYQIFDSLGNWLKQTATYNGRGSHTYEIRRIEFW